MPTSPRLSPERLDIGDSQLISSFLIHCDLGGDPKPCGRGWTGTKPPGCQRASAKKSAVTPKKAAKSASEKTAKPSRSRKKKMDSLFETLLKHCDQGKRCGASYIEASDECHVGKDDENRTPISRVIPSLKSDLSAATDKYIKDKISQMGRDDLREILYHEGADGDYNDDIFQPALDRATKTLAAQGVDSERYAGFDEHPKIKRLYDPDYERIKVAAEARLHSFNDKEVKAILPSLKSDLSAATDKYIKNKLPKMGEARLREIVEHEGADGDYNDDIFQPAVNKKTKNLKKNNEDDLDFDEHPEIKRLYDPDYERIKLAAKDRLSHFEKVYNDKIYKPIINEYHDKMEEMSKRISQAATPEEAKSVIAAAKESRKQYLKKAANLAEQNNARGLDLYWLDDELRSYVAGLEDEVKKNSKNKKKTDSLFQALLKHCDRSSSPAKAAPKPCGKGWVGTKPPGCKRTIVQGGTKKANEIREGQKKKPAVSKPVKPVRPKESIDVGDARYAKGMKALRVNKESRDGFKGDLEQLIENLGGRWSNREKAYIVSPSKTKKILDLEKSNPADRNTNVDLAWAFRPKMSWDKDKGLKPSADFIQRHEQIYGAHQKQSKPRPKMQAIAGGKPRDKSLKELFQEADNVGSKYQDPKDPPSMSAKREANKILEESGYNEAIARGMGKVKKLPKPKKDPLYDEKVAQLLGEKRARSKTPPKTGKGPRKSTDIFGKPIPIRKNVSIDSLESWLLRHDRRAYV